ncbi:MAG: hypothetical protein EA427_15265 [Spirochaetaceae bacterium]|nr:MAG: hypothetical protein EA427_15265 [Spirochaetaceae bacterium]
MTRSRSSTRSTIARSGIDHSPRGRAYSPHRFHSFGLESLNHTARMAFLEIFEDRHRRKSTMVISQQPVENWHGIIGDLTITGDTVRRKLYAVD